MKSEQLKDLRKKKRLLVLPLLTIPFLTMAFWALGGGSKGKELASKTSDGLNLQLPNAQLKDDRGETKLSYYEQAQKDSAKWKVGTDTDPFLSSSLNDSMRATPESFDPYPLQTGEYKDPNEQKVYQKLAELNHHLQSPQAYNGPDQKLNVKPVPVANSFDKGDVNRLEEMMTTVTAPNTKDPEVDQLNTMMDRILDIQHPERVKRRLNEKQWEDKEEVFSVKNNSNSYSISLLDTAKGASQSAAFYGEDVNNAAADANAIEAVIHESGSVVDGAIVKLRLLDNVSVNNTVIPKATFVFGKASLQGERLHIEIHSIRKDNSIYPVELTVYDLDGMEGLHIPGAITRDVAKESADASLQNIEMASIDPSLKVQAATAGINTAKSLLSKKVKLIKVMVKAGYKVLLKEKVR